MATTNTNPTVDFYFRKAEKWSEAVTMLREIVLSCELTEELKWGCPCYSYEKSNIVLIHRFKEYCALLFFKGALLKDPKSILIRQTANVQAARQIRFASVAEVSQRRTAIKAYVFEAVEVEESGIKVPLKKTAEFKMPAEFSKQLDKKAALKSAFENLTPGRQRAYLLHFSSAKQAATREARIEKCIPDIMKGKGLNDVS